VEQCGKAISKGGGSPQSNKQSSTRKNMVGVKQPGRKVKTKGSLVGGKALIPPTKRS